MLEEVINILFYVAEADGEVSSPEEKMIEEIAKIFGLEQHQYQSIKESRKSSDKVNPYIVLVAPQMTHFKTLEKNILNCLKSITQIY